MNFLEKDLEEIIFNADNSSLHEKGLPIFGKKIRQLKIGGYGVADIVSYEKIGSVIYIVVYELKKDKIGISAFLQALGYARGIQRYLENRDVSFDFKIGITLIGKTFDKNSTYCYLRDVIRDFIGEDMYRDFLNNFTYEYGFDGIQFTNHGEYYNSRELWTN